MSNAKEDIEYDACYLPEIDLIDFGEYHYQQADHMREDEYRGFDWALRDVPGKKKPQYFYAEVGAWERRSPEEQGELIRYICDKAGWDYNKVLAEVERTVEDSKGISRIWNRNVVK